MDTNQATMKIDFSVFFKKVYLKQKLIYTITGCFIIIGIIVAYSLPKLYSSKVILSPEANSNGNGNSISGMASILGIGGFNASGNDAINTTMFTEIIKTTPFILELYNIPVTQENNAENLPLSKYLDKEKVAWWNYLLALPQTTYQYFITPKNPKNQVQTINPYKLTQEQKSKIAVIKSSLTATEDKKNGMTTIVSTFQDPVVAAIVADSAISKLQKYIIKYRTQKAFDDYEYLMKVCKERKNEYIEAQKCYASFLDSNKNIISQRMQAEGKRLENEMSIAFNIYSQVETQLQIARAKLQEAKPVFAIIEPSTIALTPSAPNKGLIIVSFSILGLIISIILAIGDNNIHRVLRKIKD